MGAVRDLDIENAEYFSCELASLIEALPCEMVLLDKSLTVAGFNEAAAEFFSSACTLRAGMLFEELSGALWDMASEAGFGEIELLTQHIQALEDCTVDYCRFDQRHCRISAKPSSHNGVYTALIITDISDITESERFLQAQVKELSDELSILRARLKLADAMVSGREAEKLGQQFADRFSKTLDCFEDALKNDDSDMGFAELEKQREYLEGITSEGHDRTNFDERLRKSLRPSVEVGLPKVVFHHISSPGCGDLLENDIIRAAREGVILIALFGAADSIGISLRSYEGGMELNIHTDGPIVPDFERTEQYRRLKEIARRMRARLETDITNGFSLRLNCVFRKGPALPMALIALADTGFAAGVIRTLGSGPKQTLRCIAASADIDLLKACKEYAPGLLIAEAGRVVGHAAALKQCNSEMKIIAVFPPDSPIHMLSSAHISGYVSRDMEQDALRVAVNGVMHGLTVRAGSTDVSHVDAAIRRYGLTEVERSIICMIGQGASSEKIAATLHYSQGSLRNMLSAVYEKLGISDRAQLTAFAIFNGFSENFQT